MKRNINGSDRDKKENGAAILLKRAAYIIDAERSQMNMTQRELAEAIGVSQTTISNWINRDKTNAHPNLYQLLKLCCATNMSLDELFKSIAAADKNEKEKLPEDIYNDLQSFVGILKKIMMPPRALPAAAAELVTKSMKLLKSTQVTIGQKIIFLA